MKKLIGITGPSSFTDDITGVVENYLGADFVLLYHNNIENILAWTERCDGIILGGGTDIHPSTYGRDVMNSANLSKFDSIRDNRELAILDHAMNTNTPVLGICRGHQLIGLYYGLKKYFQMDISGGHVVHSPSKGGVQEDKHNPLHKIRLINTEHFAFEIPQRKKIGRIVIEENALWINSYHHQAILFDSIAEYNGIYILGTSPLMYGKKEQTNIIELMRGATKPWISTQWHPELDADINPLSRAVFDNFTALLETV